MFFFNLKEHKCVLDSCRSLEAEGFEVSYLPVKTNGLIDIKQLEDTIRPDTSLVSVMTVNNEIGVRQPIEDIGEAYVLLNYAILFRFPKVKGISYN